MMPDDFGKEEYSLHSAHVQVVEGLIFICLAVSAPDFSSIKKSLSPYLKPYRINEAKLATIKKIYAECQLEISSRKFP